MLPAVTLAVLHHTPSNPISRRVKRAKTFAPGASILSDLPVVVGAAKVAVTWSAAPQVVAEPPELRLQGGRAQGSKFNYDATLAQLSMWQESKEFSKKITNFSQTFKLIRKETLKVLEAPTPLLLLLLVDRQNIGARCLHFTLTDKRLTKPPRKTFRFEKCD